jgi:hypothetical protein
MSVEAAPGQVAVPAANGTGSVLCTWDAPEVVNLAPSPPAGTDRIDLIVCQSHGQDLDGGNVDDFVIAAVDGSAGQGPSPTPPAVPPGAVALAHVHVNGGAASVAAADITDVRPFGLAVGGGPAALPPPLAAGAAFQSFTDATGEVWVAKGGVNAGAWKRARDALHARWWRNAAYNVTTAGTTIPFDMMAYDPWGLYDSNAWGYFAPIAGMYLVTGAVGMIPPAAGQAFATNILVDGGLQVSASVHSSMGWGLAPLASAIVPCNAHSLLQLQGGVSQNCNGQGGPVSCWSQLDYYGTG